MGEVSWCFINTYQNINAADSVVKSFSNVINTEMHEANAVLQGWLKQSILRVIIL
jgi:hypothetical protein